MMDNSNTQLFDMNSIYDFSQLMVEKDIIMIYEGEFNQDITKTVLNMTESSLTDIGLEGMVRKKIFNIMVEMLQNVCKHQYSECDFDSGAIFIVGDDDNDFFVSSGNIIENSKIEIVRSKIDKVNSLSKIELKDFYKESRLNSTISDVGGAGLGFIDIARKSGRKIEYMFSTLSEDYSFFIQLSRISKTEVND